ncbi:hypothetical protein CRG98_004209 [Punica granatum]|uniref:Uncharacterized protein n=1 Tax=Punica granatum TaxID=22663 RepID=A0A2I0L464_PUNGR|nr:hypothetical protein CRG98_004209 [Punica granatum]
MSGTFREPWKNATPIGFFLVGLGGWWEGVVRWPTGVLPPPICSLVNGGSRYAVGPPPPITAPQETSPEALDASCAIAWGAMAGKPPPFSLSNMERCRGSLGWGWGFRFAPFLFDFDLREKEGQISGGGTPSAIAPSGDLVEGFWSLGCSGWRGLTPPICLPGNKKRPADQTPMNLRTTSCFGRYF